MSFADTDLHKQEKKMSKAGKELLRNENPQLEQFPAFTQNRTFHVHIKQSRKAQ